MIIRPMIIKVSDIPDEGLTIERAALADAPFSDPAWRLDGLSLRLERDRLDVLAQGEIRATVPRLCGRCLVPFGARVTAGVDVRVVPRPATGDIVELAPDDLDVEFYEKDELDLNVLVETETTLALPMKPLCREDCLGLCPVCGGNRNVVTCGCRIARPTRGWPCSKTWRRDALAREAPPCRCRNDATRRRAGANAARTTSSPRRRARYVRSAERSSCRTESAGTAATTRLGRSSPSKGPSLKVAVDAM